MNTTWRFAERYGNENGLDTSDMETFKKDPNASLAREIAQNSIDAASGGEPVKIEFKVFELDREDLPGIKELSDEIGAINTWLQDDNKDKKQMSSIEAEINKKKITCLRISDFNTKGLIGVSNNNRKTPFYNLTKGSGVSDKTGTAGGSKGIGKFASFVASSTNTVFYSSVTIKDEQGYIGVSKLRSKANENDEDLLTEGLGYYADGEKNFPIQGELILDKDFIRAKDNPGTDVYIIGYKNRKGWQNVIVAKILESFMAAILFGRLEVVVDDITVDRNTVRKLIYESDTLAKSGKKAKRDIEAQYELLSQGEGEKVFSKNLKVGNDNDITVYVKQYSSKEADRATKHCVMIRYPYMKIKYTLNHSFLPYSAICIIHDNDLNKKLRDIENPQHTDWEIKRLIDEPEKQAATKALKDELDEVIDGYIEQIMQQNSSDSTDMEGAGEFLPSQSDEDVETGGEKPTAESDNVTATPVKRVKATSPQKAKTGTASETYEFGEGGEGEEDGGRKPSESPTPPNPNPDPDHEPKDDDQSGQEGKQPILIKTELSGMRYRIIVKDKDRNIYDVVFTSAFTEDNCEMSLKQFGASEDKYAVNILNAEVNGEQCTIEDGKITGMKIIEDEHYKISCEVDVNTLFAGEVVLYAYR